MDPLRPRRTHLGHVPSAWLRPRRFAVVMRLLVVVLGAVGLTTLGSSLEPLDMRLLYHPDDVAGILDAMGEVGRAQYRLFAFADLVFIVVYSVLLTTWVKFLRVRGGLPRVVVPALALLPALCDAVETGGALVLLGQFPALDRTWTLAVSIATPMKWLTLLATVAIIVRGEWVHWQQRADPR